MGCVQSAPRRRLTKREAVVLAEETEVARLLAIHNQQAALNAAVAEHKAPERLPRRDTLVLKKAGQFDKLHEDALRPPPLQAVTVIRGKESMRLLEGFEAKEAESRAVPQLVAVERSDLRSSKLFDKLKEYEDNDKRAAAEPRLEKTFIQRQRESSGSIATRSSASSAGTRSTMSGGGGSLNPLMQQGLAVPV